MFYYESEKSFIKPFCIVSGYEIIIEDMYQRCDHRNGNQIASYLDTDVLTCARLCSNTEACGFFFLNYKNWCALYKTCFTRYLTTSPGSTFGKLIQGNIYTKEDNQLFTSNKMEILSC